MSNDTSLKKEIDSFLLDRRARNLSPRTILWYRISLNVFRTYLEGEGVCSGEAITPTLLRLFVLCLKERGYNPGGVRNIYCAVQAFLNWFESDIAPEGWLNPLRKVKAPKVPQTPIPPVPIASIRAMLETCETGTPAGDRGLAILLFLLDTGVRHQELTDINMGDVDLEQGSVHIRSGKGAKSRVVFFGNQTQRALVTYLHHFAHLGLSPDDGLWQHHRLRHRLHRDGLRQVVRRRAQDAGVRPPGMHGFRRAFAVAYLRNGGDVITLQRLMGHTTLAMTQRYLALVDDDLRAAHAKFGAVDHMLA